MGSVEGKVALITGSGQNIGRAVAELLAREGASVVVNCARSKDKVDTVVETIQSNGGQAIGIMADVSIPEDVKQSVDETEAKLGSDIAA